MTATTWIETSKALHRMARRGGKEWNRLKGRLPPDQRVELARLNQRVETLAAELKETEQGVERENAARQERLRLRSRWEDTRRVALDPPEAFELAKRLVAILHLESARKYRTKDLARRVDADANSPAFLEAIQLSLIAGFAERTTSGKLRAVRAADLRARGMKFDRLDSSMAEMCERLDALRVAPMWMLHRNGSEEAPPTEFQTVLNQLIVREDGLTWAGPGIVARASADLESLEADQVWPPLAQKERGTAEIERDLNRAKEELKGPLKAAAEKVWARREEKPASREEKPASPIESARDCRGCGAKRETDGSYCPDCGIKYEKDRGLPVTDLRNRRRGDFGLRPETGSVKKAS